jgi:hypothetical protein
VTYELRRRGIPPGQRLRVVVENIEADEPSITAMNCAGGAFDWLAEEPDLYSDADLVADRHIFTLDAKSWDAFVAALDGPPQRHPRLERLFCESSVFETESPSESQP